MPDPDIPAWVLCDERILPFVFAPPPYTSHTMALFLVSFCVGVAIASNHRTGRDEYLAVTVWLYALCSIQTHQSLACNIQTQRNI
jgi:hypothetical protein